MVRRIECGWSPIPICSESTFPDSRDARSRPGTYSVHNVIVETIEDKVKV